MSELDIDESMAETLAEIKERDSDENESETEAHSTDESADKEDAGGSEDTGTGEEVEAKADSEESTSEEAVPEEDDTEEPEKDTEESSEEEVGNAPTAYSAAAKDDWAKTPKSVRDAAIKREEDSNKGVQMLKEKSDFGTRLSDAAGPYMAMIQSKGATLESFIVGQGNTMHGLQFGTPDQKVAILRSMASLAQVDIANIQPPSEIERQLAPYMSKINTLEQQINQQSQQTTNQQDSAINQALDAFEKETDDKGDLTHPYFHNVENEMVSSIPSIRQNNPHFSHAEVLQKAYDNSIWANPETRQHIQVQQDKAAEQERKRKAKEVAAKAKKANKVNLPKKGQPDSSQADTLGSIDDTMAATMKEIKRR